ncbi:hypothetical protein Lfu02_60380 [Longispora fulva]|uniref:Secreted protein n=1 Tax=Longispora fulva TaxID=619741 RepID=A0A8J7GTK5_9ACTN|nr:hypothetical protein [Longispora fulva]MBG6136981.1 hypothetical protein [Longispora fulva]GIG61666.1 hypothetical protein Lfu02_60380 [Longispora fulva]
MANARMTRRLSVLGAVALGAGAVVGVAAPAQAMPTCRAVYSIGYSAAGNAIHASGNRACFDTGTVTPLPVTILRLDPATGTWSAVAAGTGSVQYPCVTAVTNTYRLQQDALRTVTANCG